MNTTQLYGAWISPDGKIHKTNNIRSHAMVIKELCIEKNLIQKQKEFDWTSEQIRFGLHHDLAFTALRCGYIRVIMFKNQFSVEMYDFIDNNKSSYIDEIFSFYDNDEKIFENFSVEIINRGIFQQFKTYKDFRKFIVSMTRKSNNLQ